MTTIACTPLLMAADSWATDANGISSVTKIWRVGDGVLGFAGTFAQGYQFVRWLEARRGDPPDIDGSAFLFIDGHKIWCYDGCPDPYPLDDKFAAIGTGGMAAMACMHVGCDPVQAVKVAAKIDPHTGGKIRTMEV